MRTNGAEDSNTDIVDIYVRGLDKTEDLDINIADIDVEGVDGAKNSDIDITDMNADVKGANGEEDSHSAKADVEKDSS